jgi:hypothetical protein
VSANGNGNRSIFAAEESWGGGDRGVWILLHLVEGVGV